MTNNLKPASCFFAALVELHKQDMSWNTHPAHPFLLPKFSYEICFLNAHIITTNTRMTERETVDSNTTFLLSNICCYCVLLLPQVLWVTVSTLLSEPSPPCVFVFCGGGGGRWTNMSLWVSDCRANIDQQHSWQHAGGQIMHGSNGHGAQKPNDMSYHLVN